MFKETFEEKLQPLRAAQARVAQAVQAAYDGRPGAEDYQPAKERLGQVQDEFMAWLKSRRDWTWEEAWEARARVPGTLGMDEEDLAISDVGWDEVRKAARVQTWAPEAGEAWKELRPSSGEFVSGGRAYTWEVRLAAVRHGYWVRLPRTTVDDSGNDVVCRYSEWFVEEEEGRVVPDGVLLGSGRKLCFELVVTADDGWQVVVEKREVKEELYSPEEGKQLGLRGGGHPPKPSPAGKGGARCRTE